MPEFLSHAFGPAVLIFIVSTMLACGLSLTLGEIFGPFRNLRLAAFFLIGSYILIPLLAFIITRIFHLEAGLGTGLIILAMAAGAEAGPKAAAISGANVGLSVGILITSLGISIFYVPILIGLVLPGVHIETGHLLVKLLVTVGLPIILGLFIKARFDKFAERIVHYLHKISTLFMIIAASMLVMIHLNQIIASFGTGILLAAFIFIAAGFGIGYLLGLPDRGSSLAMGYMHGGRNSSIALVIASQAFSDKPQVLLMITIGVTMMVIVLIPLSFILKIKPDAEYDGYGH